MDADLQRFCYILSASLLYRKTIRRRYDDDDDDATTTLQRYIDIYYDSINNIYEMVMTVLWYGLYYAVNHYSTATYSVYCVIFLIADNFLQLFSF